MKSLKIKPPREKLFKGEIISKPEINNKTSHFLKEGYNTQFQIYYGLEVNYKTCPLEIRECLAKHNVEELIIKLKEENLDDFFILSTCNRFGIYGIITDEKKITSLIAFPIEYTQVFKGVDLIRHIFRVASGLESQIIGEHQILGQIKESFTLGIKYNSIKNYSNRLLATAIKTAKRIKNETNLETTSINYFIKKLIEGKNIKNVLVFGTGEIGNTVIGYLSTKFNVCVVSKNINRALKMAKIYNIKPISYIHIKEHLSTFDLIISTTNNDKFLLDLEDINNLKDNVILIDLAVPRSINPSLIKFFNLYNLDNFNQIEYAINKIELQKANSIIEEEIKNFLDSLKERKAHHIIKHFRDEQYSKVLHFPTIYIKKLEINKEIKIGTRGSLLALAQTKKVINKLEKLFPYYNFSIKIIKTQGDEGKIEGKGAFVKNIEDKLKNGEIDIAVHSLKDMPLELDPHLTITAIMAREDPRDVLITKNKCNLMQLKECSVIGTSSQRRIAQLSALRNDLIYKELKGNIDTRIKKLESGEYDGIVVAKASLDRLNLSNLISEIFDVEVIVPPAGQGAIAIQTRENDFFINNLTILLNDEKTWLTTKIEREFLHLISSGCRMPHGVHCFIKDNYAFIIAYVNSKKYKLQTTLSQINTLPYKLFEKVSRDL